jgi:TolA-binding protein
MRATLQSASDRLRQIENDKTDLAALFAELQRLREMVRQEEAKLRAKRVHQGKSTIVAPIKFASPLTGHRTAG